MSINFKTSGENSKYVRELTRALPCGDSLAENVIARIALAYSLGRPKARKFSVSDNAYNSGGKEYKESTFFGNDREFYLAIVTQYYGRKLSEDDLQKLIKLHVDDGLEALHNIFKNKGREGFISEICSAVSDGVGFLPVGSADTPRSLRVAGTGGCTNVIEIDLGTDAVAGTAVSLRLNDEGCPNAHIAIAGQSGSGKTQVACEMLAQIHEKSGGKTKFIFLDFKGSKESDVSKFLRATDAEFVSPLNEKPFPLNPLSVIDAANLKRRQNGIRVFANIVCNCCGKGRLGAKQKNSLIEALKEAFDHVPETGKKPTLSSLVKILDEHYEEEKKPSDTLSATLHGLAESDFFSAAEGSDFLGKKNLYVSLGAGLSGDVRFTALFVIVYSLYVMFSEMPDAEVSDDVRALRYVIFIDEAQNILGNVALSESVETMLRELRAKGVSVCLATQEIRSFFTKRFNFSSQCATAVLFKINEMVPGLVSKFLGVGKDAKLDRALGKLSSETGKGLALVKSGNTVPAGTLVSVKQFHARP